jgi:sigma54-dependent transcription regulator
MNNKKSLEEYQQDYRWLAEQVREAAQKASTERERADLLARAKLWDFLAERYAIPH